MGIGYMALVAAMALQIHGIGATYMSFLEIGTFHFPGCFDVRRGNLIPVSYRQTFQRANNHIRPYVIGILFIFRGLGLGNPWDSAQKILQVL